MSLTLTMSQVFDLTTDGNKTCFVASGNNVVLTHLILWYFEKYKRMHFWEI